MTNGCYSLYIKKIKNIAKGLSDKNLLFWRLWFCNYLYNKYKDDSQTLIIETNYSILTEDELHLLKQIIDYCWDIIDNNNVLDKNKLDELNQKLENIDVSDLDLVNEIDCALLELIQGLELILYTLITGKRKYGFEYIIFRSTINVIDKILDDNGLDILKQDGFNSEIVQSEISAQYQILDYLLNNQNISSDMKNLFREKQSK